MEAWRKRISFITERFEAAAKDSNTSQKPLALPTSSSASAVDAKKEVTHCQSSCASVLRKGDPTSQVRESAT